MAGPRGPEGSSGLSLWPSVCGPTLLCVGLILSGLFSCGVPRSSGSMTLKVSSPCSEPQEVYPYSEQPGALPRSEALRRAAVWTKPASITANETRHKTVWLRFYGSLHQLNPRRQNAGWRLPVGEGRGTRERVTASWARGFLLGQYEYFILFILLFYFLF